LCRDRVPTLRGLSLDHLIRPLQQRRRDRQAQGLGRLEVDHELEFRWLLDRQRGGLGGRVATVHAIYLII
jgi:hypothetical protein